MANDKKTALEAIQEVKKSVRTELMKFKNANTVVPAREAALQIKNSLTKQIESYKDELVKLRKMEDAPGADMPMAMAESSLEVESNKTKRQAKHWAAETKPPFKKAAAPLTKDGPSVTSAPTQSDAELVHDMGKKTTVFDKLAKKVAPKETVFDKMKKCGQMSVVKSDKVLDIGDFGNDTDKVGGDPSTRRVMIKSPSEKHVDPAVPGAELPSEGPSKDADAEKQGSGSQLKKGKSLKKNDCVFDKMKKKAASLDKSMPKLGMKDSGSKMMTTHAMSDASSIAAQQKNAKMPTNQQMKPKMPTMEEHAARASQFADFMPKIK